MLDINQHIKSLLHEYDSVALPGLGSFVTAYKPAGIDVVLGLLSPPSRQIDFNPNLRMDDGLLAARISERHRMSIEEASALVNSYIDNILTALSQRELVLLADIGKIYLDFQGELRFLPENTNYNLDTFGLPEVKFYPVFRSRESKGVEGLINQAQHTPEIPDSPEVPSRKIFHFPVNYRKMALPSAAAVLFTGVLAAWLWWGSGTADSSTTDPLNQKVSQIRVNEKPTSDTDGIGYEELPPIPADPELKSSTTPETVSPKADDHYIDTEKPAASIDESAAANAPTGKSAIIIIGSFKDKNNIRKLVADIIDAGYDVYQYKASGGLTRVGVQLAYSKDSELNRHLTKIRTKFNPSSFVQR